MTSDHAGAQQAQEQLAALEAISRSRPDRLLRLSGQLGDDSFELLIFRGFSSSTTHPTAFDPDQPLLPWEARITAAELLAAPLDPAAEQRLAGPAAPHRFLDPAHWL